MRWGIRPDWQSLWKGSANNLIDFLKKIILYGAIMISLASCLFYFYYKVGRFNNVYSEVHNRLERMQEKYERLDSGKWYSNKGGMYYTLSFGHENAVLIDNHVDTIFRYKYTLNQDTLWLQTDEKHLVPNKIKLFNRDELIFDSFLDEKKELRYSRKDSLQK